MKTKIIGLIVILALVFNFKNLKSQENKIYQANYSDSLTYELEKQAQKESLAGFTVGIVNDNKILYNKGFGYSNFELKKEYTINTIQSIASVSKTLIGVALLKAQEQGFLLLDDPINKHLPFKVLNPYYPNNKITIRHLATHTSTILDTDYYDQITYILNENTKLDAGDTEKYGAVLNNPDKEISMESFLKKLLSVDGEWRDSTGFMNEKPGSKFEYSNVGATLAALVLEYATGVRYADYTRKYILKPLKMNNSGWSNKDVDIHNQSILYMEIGDPVPPFHSVTYPDGGLISSSSDLALYLKELINGYFGKGELLKQDSYQQLFKEYLTVEHFHDRDTTSCFNDEYNSGIFMGFTPCGYVGHTGADPGIVVYMFFNPKTKTGRILMTNTWLWTRESINEFYSIWKILGKYENLLSK